MGFVQHHAIIVTCWDEAKSEDALKVAQSLGNIAVIAGSQINGYSTVMVAPDGSKEGWADSDNGDTNRSEFIKWLKLQRHEDGSCSYEWVEVSYGNDPGTATIESHEWEDEKDDS